MVIPLQLALGGVAPDGSKFGKGCVRDGLLREERLLGRENLSPPRRGKPSVLVVDDSAEQRELLVLYLRFRNFKRVAEAESGSTAIAVVGRMRPDIILMDLAMPDMDGWEATRRLKSNPLTRTILIVAVTAHAFPRELDAARDAGCDAIVIKPYKLAVLARTLERVAAGITTSASLKRRRAI
jgi:two-component system cell cycle response regulator DivK